MIDADNGDRTSCSSPSLTISSLSPIRFRRGGIRRLRDPLPGGRGDAAPKRNGVHHVQTGADHQLDQVPHRAVRGLLRGVRGDRKVSREGNFGKFNIYHSSQSLSVTPNQSRVAARYSYSILSDPPYFLRNGWTNQVRHICGFDQSVRPSLATLTE